MRTEKEVKDQLDYLKGVMETAMRRYFKDGAEDEFARIYSHVWDEMKHLYWVLGFEPVEAARNVGTSMTDLFNTVRADIANT